MNMVKNGKNREKILTLRNRYTNEIVMTKSYNQVENSDGNAEFIKVYKPANPERIYLVNRTAFEIVNK